MKTKQQAAEEYDNSISFEGKIKREAFESGIEFAESWIDVNEELPEVLPFNDSMIIENDDLLLLKYKPYGSLEFGVLRRTNHCTYWEIPDVGNCVIEEVTHWRPINRK